jgi:hypothetical protein
MGGDMVCRKTIARFLGEHATLTAGKIAERFLFAIRDCADLSNGLRGDLFTSAKRFKALTQERNDLLHAHPYTAGSGESDCNEG